MAKIRLNLEFSINTENISEINQKELIENLGEILFDENNVKKYLNNSENRVIGIRITDKEEDIKFTEIF